LLEQSVGRVGEQTSGQPGHGRVSLSKFIGVAAERIPVQADSGQIAAGERPGPGGARPVHLLIVEHLAGQPQESAGGLAALHAGGGEQTDTGLHGSEDVSGGKGPRAMILHLAAGLDADGFAADAADHPADDAESLGMAFDAEKHAIEAGAGARGETLHGMNDAGPGGVAGQGSENGGTERAAGVEDDFAAEIGAATLGELGGNGGKRIVGNGEEDDGSIEHAAGEHGTGNSGADGADGGAGGGQMAGGDGGDAPSGFAEPGAKAASDAACADDGESAMRSFVGPAHDAAAFPRAILNPQRNQTSEREGHSRNGDCILPFFTWP